MTDGGRTIAHVAGVEVCIYDAMRDTAEQFCKGNMSIDEFSDILLTLVEAYEAKGGVHAHC